MPCDCCCTKTLRLCKQNVCDGSTLDLGITVQVDGPHTLTLEFLGLEVNVGTVGVYGEPLAFPLSSLNESFTYRGRVYDPAGKQVVIEKDSIQYDCFEFQTVLRYAVA